MIKQETFESLYREELLDLYDAERQIVYALPDIVAAVTSQELKAAFAEHLEQTKEQLARLEALLTAIGEAPGSKLCPGVRELLSQARMLVSSLPASPVLDAALIAAAQKVEHYEIAGYGTVRTMAEMLNHEAAARLLQKTLAEEKDADSTLSDIAETVMGGIDLEEQEEAETEQEVAG